MRISQKLALLYLTKTGIKCQKGRVQSFGKGLGGRHFIFVIVFTSAYSKNKSHIALRGIHIHITEMSTSFKHQISARQHNFLNFLTIKLSHFCRCLCQCQSSKNLLIIRFYMLRICLSITLKNSVHFCGKKIQIIPIYIKYFPLKFINFPNLVRPSNE